MRRALGVFLLSVFFAGNSFAAVVYDHSSLTDVNVIESGLGGGVWQYDFTVTNNEASNIWHFIFWTEADIIDITSSFPNEAHNGSLNSVYSAYDARNIDSSVAWLQNAWDTPFGGATGLQAGETATFSITSYYQIADFLYGYETGESGYAVENGTGKIAAIGTASAVPVPAAVWLFGSALGGLGWMRRKRAG